MIPVLYDSKETAFKTQGLGRLTEAYGAKVKWELNATYEMSFSYPVSGKRFGNIKPGRLVWCEPYPGGEPQAFRIYEVSKDMSGSIDVSCEHISYELNNIPVSPYQAKTANAALTGIKQQSLCDNPFTLQTNMTAAGDFQFDTPTMARTLLCGGDDSVQGVFGGELLFDNYNIYLMDAIGKDNGAVLRYGKNITDLKQEENIQDTVSGVVPYYKTSDGNLIYLPEKVLYSKNASEFPYVKIGLLDCADMAGDAENYTPSTTELRNYATKWMDDNGVGTPAVSINVSYVDLEREGLTAIHPGDTVGVLFVGLGVNKKAEVVGYEYDVIAGRYTSATVGEPFPDLAVTLLNQQKSTISAAVSAAESKTESAAAEAVSYSNRYRKSGNKKVTLSDATDVQIFAMSDLDTMFDLESGTCTNANTVISAINADTAITTAVSGIFYNSGAWHIRFASKVAGDVLVAYTAQYFGGD